MVVVSERRPARGSEDMPMSEAFWAYLDALLRSATLVIDRPKGSAHPRYPALIYPLDYGFLAGTSGGDGNEVDVWRGSNAAGVLDAVLCTVDLTKRDVEIKLLVGCTTAEKDLICRFHNDGSEMRAILVARPGDPPDGTSG